MLKYNDYFKPIVAKVRYSEKNALSLAIACDLAYKKQNLIKKTARAWGYAQVEFLEIRKGSDIDTQVFVMSDDKNVIIVFRGSDDLKDWFTNFQAVKDPGPLEDTKAHEGFQDALYPAVIKLTEIIDRFGADRPDSGEFAENKKKIWVTGHSLGGALCSLYAGMLIENAYSIFGIYTFASPRPGDESFAKALNNHVVGPHYRVVNTGDVVPHVPPEPFFSHPGKRIILKNSKKETSKRSWFAQRIIALKVFVKNTGNLFDVADNHRLSADDESYIPRLIKDAARKR